MENVVAFPDPLDRLARRLGMTLETMNGLARAFAVSQKLNPDVVLLRTMSRDRLRFMWDNIGDNSFFEQFDCADIHLAMNLNGDGSYCAV